MIRSNAAIVGYRIKAGDDPSGGDLLTRVDWPEGRRVPCEVEDYSQERIATLASLGVRGERRVVVALPALRGAGVPAESPRLGDVIDIADAGEAPGASRAWRVLGVRGGKAGLAWSAAVILHVGPVA